MDFLRQESLLPVIQLAITPVILIAGLGSLLLSMTNRMARIVDRTRILAGQVQGDEVPADRQHHAQQLRIMFHRAKLLRLAVTLNSAAIFCAALLVALLFVSALADAEAQVGRVIVGIFVACLVCLVGGLVAFIRDIFLSLEALGLEVSRALGDR